MRRLILALSILVLLVATVVGGSSVLRETRLNRVNATYKSCVANLRVLEGAVEIYYMDHEDSEKTVESVNDLINNRMDELIQGKYLRESLQNTVQGYFYELPIPKDALPVCHITAVASGTDYILECNLHGSQYEPRPLEELLRLIKLDSAGNYVPSR